MKGTVPSFWQEEQNSRKIISIVWDNSAFLSSFQDRPISHYRYLFRYCIWQDLTDISPQPYYNPGESYQVSCNDTYLPSRYSPKHCQETWLSIPGIVYLL